MARVICLCNQKGGVGKTTTSVNLASCLALSKKATLLIDLDPQANASSGLGVRLQPGEPCVYDLLLSRESFSRVVKKTEVEGLDLAPASQNLIGAEVEFVSLPNRERMMVSVIETVRSSYDFILIDCPPSLGFLTLNALVASDAALIPIQCEYYALEGVGNLMSAIKRVKAHFNPRLEIEGFLLTMFDSRNNLAHQVAHDVKNHFTSQVFDTVIPRNVRLSESPSFGKPVVLYDIASRGAAGYLALAKEILDAEGNGTSEEAYCAGAGT